MNTQITTQQRRNLAELEQLLRRELNTALESTRETLLAEEAAHHEAALQQEAIHHEAMMSQLREMQAQINEVKTTVNGLANGSIQLGIQGMAFFGNPITTIAPQPALQQANSREPPRQPAAAQLAPIFSASSSTTAFNPPTTPGNACSSSTRITNLGALLSPGTGPGTATSLPPADNQPATPAPNAPPPIPRAPRLQPNAVPPPGTPGGPPAYTLLKLRTVPEAWAEWKTGVNGGPAVEELERVWGGAWRPTGKARVAFCRRKVIWDEIGRLMRAGQSEEEAVQRLEGMRAGGSLVELGKVVRSSARRGN